MPDIKMPPPVSTRHVDPANAKMRRGQRMDDPIISSHGAPRSAQSASAVPGSNAGPLAGIRILDLTSVLTAPYATSILWRYGCRRH